MSGFKGAVCISFAAPGGKRLQFTTFYSPSFFPYSSPDGTCSL